MEALQRFNVRLKPSQVAELEKLSRRLTYLRNYQITWADLLRTGAEWALAKDGERPPRTEPANNPNERT